MAPLTETLREGLSLWGARAESLDEGVDEAFDERRRRKLVAHGASVAAFALAGAVLFWPVDWVVLDAVARRAFSQWRVVVALLAALYLGLARWSIAPRVMTALLVASLFASTAVAGDAMARAGDPGTPFLHLLYLPLFATITLPFTLGVRAAITIGVALSAAVGYWGLHPAYRGHPAGALWWSVMLSVASLVVWLGHTLFLLARENFAHQRRLSTWNHELELHVAERTAELRALLAHIEGVREDERTRIARELHDELGQELTGLAFVARHTSERFERDPGAIRANLGEIESGLQRTTALVRELVSDLRPRMLDDLGLVAAVEWLARRTEERAGVRCGVRADELGELPSSTRTVAFRVVQESLTNVLKHARATAVTIELRRESRALVLSVADDGVGFDPQRASVTRRGGAGLLGMRERVQSIGGTLSVLRGDSQGTVVRCSLPR
ncbi:MAG: sensor histidine kinase [Myxococcales bacterium]|nr:sensor histidine kinase [Myxococcales bacterium]